MPVPSEDLKFALATAAIEAANATKNAINLAAEKNNENDFSNAGAISSMAANCAAVARDLSSALVLTEERYPETP